MAGWAKFHIPVVLAWSLGIGAGFWSLVKYEATPGKAAAAQADWPAGAGIERKAGLATLVMAAHPGCPCSKASLSELRELLERYPNRLECYVLFVTQPEAGVGAAECRGSELWKIGAAIRGVTCIVDEKNLAVGSFHAATSGQIFLYDGSGRLQFSGGITAARDHAGENDGISAIQAFLTTGAAPVAHTPVFGCSLR